MQSDLKGRGLHHRRRRRQQECGTSRCRPSRPAPPPKDGLALREEAISFDPQTQPHLPDRAGPRQAAGAVEGHRRAPRLRPHEPAATGPGGRLRVQPRDHLHDGTTESRTAARAVQAGTRGNRLQGRAADDGPRRHLREQADPKDLQGRIDRMFEGSGLLASARLERGAPADKRIEADVQRQIDVQILGSRKSWRGPRARPCRASSTSAPGRAWTELQTQMFGDLSLRTSWRPRRPRCRTSATSTSPSTTSGTTKVRSTSSYFTEKGLSMPRLEEDELLAATAERRARVLDTVETGGLYVAQKDGNAGSDGRWNETFAFKTLRTAGRTDRRCIVIAEPGATAMTGSTTRPAPPTRSASDPATRTATAPIARSRSRSRGRTPRSTTATRLLRRKELAAFNRRDSSPWTASRPPRGSANIDDIKVKLDATSSARATAPSSDRRREIDRRRWHSSSSRTITSPS